MKNLAIWLFFTLILATAATHAGELKPYPDSATPPLVLKDLKGKTHKLDDYRGQVVLVNFWASWCPPCRLEIPSLQRLKNKMAGKPFAILAVDMGETPKVVNAYLKTMHTDFTVLLDSNGHVLQAWKVFAFPTTFVIDGSGKIRYALFGGAEWDDADIMQKLNALLPGATP